MRTGTWRECKSCNTYKGLAETAKLAKGLRGLDETVFGLAGAGDMALSGKHDLETFLGVSLAKKQPFDDKLTEINSSKMAIKIAKKLK